jgi:KUP system potassium uptake protein
MPQQTQPRASNVFLLAVASLGVVFGDIGTSPMYAIKESMLTPGLPAAAESVLGIVSFVFWSLLSIVSLKYLVFVTLADNEGEGGIFAMVSALKSGFRGTRRWVVLFASGLGMAAIGLMFADTLITPALSVMAATEGLALEFPDIREWTAGLAVLVLLALFYAQHLGTALLARLFAPVMLCWFLALAALGAIQVWQAPQVLAAVSPLHAVHLFNLLSWPQRMGLLGSILLAVTGAEAIYADMGHFGRRPIALAWHCFAVWALLLNYFGQGAWLLRTQTFAGSETSPFFALIPAALLLPMGLLAVLASIIASQAVISGMFSLVSQAIQLNYLPRLKVVHTSADERGQIYLPRINLLLAVGAVLLVLGFGSSVALASAYGFAIAATMTVTTVAFVLLAHSVWRWSVLKVVVFSAFSLPLDCLFLAAAMTKLPDGRYLTLFIALGVVFLLWVWRAGNRYLMELAQRLDMPVALFADMVAERADLHRQARPAVFFQHLPFPADRGITPNALLRQVQLTSLLYQPTVIVDFSTRNGPRVSDETRIHLRTFPNGIYAIDVSFGFAEPVSMDPVLAFGQAQGWWQGPDEIVYYLGREEIRFAADGGLPGFMKWPFLWLHRQDESLGRTLKLPAAQHAELGTTVDI